MARDCVLKQHRQVQTRATRLWWQAMMPAPEDAHLGPRTKRRMDFHSPKAGASKLLALESMNWSQQLPKFALPNQSRIRGTEHHRAETALGSHHLALSHSRKNITSFRTSVNINSLIWDYLLLMVHLGVCASSEVQWIFTLALITVTHPVPLCNYKMQSSSEFSSWKMCCVSLWNYRQGSIFPKPKD